MCACVCVWSKQLYIHITYDTCRIGTIKKIGKKTKKKNGESDLTRSKNASTMRWSSADFSTEGTEKDRRGEIEFSLPHSLHLLFSLFSLFVPTKAIGSISLEHFPSPFLNTLTRLWKNCFEQTTFFRTLCLAESGFPLSNCHGPRSCWHIKFVRCVHARSRPGGATRAPA